MKRRIFSESYLNPRYLKASSLYIFWQIVGLYNINLYHEHLDLDSVLIRTRLFYLKRSSKIFEKKHWSFFAYFDCPVAIFTLFIILLYLIANLYNFQIFSTPSFLLENYPDSFRRRVISRKRPRFLLVSSYWALSPPTPPSYHGLFSFSVAGKA